MGSTNTELVVRFLERAWSSGDLAAVDECVDPDFVNFGVRRGTEGMRRIIVLWRTAFPDFRYTVDGSLAEGDLVALRLTATGTHVGEFRHPAMGVLPPTGRSFSVDQAHTFRLAEGLIAEHWATRNDLALMQQLGALPAPTSRP